MAQAAFLHLAGAHGGAAADDLRPRSPDAVGRGAAMALGAHALLIVALAFGVSWKRSTPEGIEAELWAAVPQVAAPRAEPPPPAPEPRPEPKPTPPVAVKPPPPPDTSEADIAREKRKKQLELEKQKAAEEAEQKKLADKKAAEKKAAEDEKKRELAEKQKLEKAAADKRQADAAETARIEKQRQANIKNMMGAAAGTGAPDSSGAAAQSAGPSAGYAGRIKARIKPNVVFNADDVDGNPLASVEVRTAPDGRIIGRKLLKSSGSAAWDEAVLRAIDKTEMLPRDTDGRVPSSLVIDFKPRDL
ncbi:cell envelope integrity protein TolA [Rivibacter subsaxonicus]|uniref:Cell division and transport-associated protein TolA n=1 Tax=Rivibacter subsaxonicus TaxID=457575 RepID=A0A4V2FTF5_9BURK|nr:cell envelope integrity protein TolA [Rivibacter subsaxonicus]RZT97935.1 cell division and transport-associated protein TolA [Rivibacter subsaxonicus]